MKVLLADRLPEEAVSRLEAAGDEVTSMPDLTAESLPDHIADAEVLVVRSTKVTGPTLDAAAKLGLVVRAGAGTNNIDCDHAAELGVFVCNVPGRNAFAVAELTLGLVLAADRHIADATFDARNGRWEKTTYSKAMGLFGRTLAIIGVGQIGLAVAERASGFGMNVIAVAKPDRSAAKLERAEAAGISFVDTLDEMLAAADIVTLHIPGSTSSKGLVNAEFLSRMRDGATLINTSRGDVVDEAALIEAMDSRDMKAGLDVFADEPAGGSAVFDSVLARHPNVVATHHVGASTDQAQSAVADGTVDTIDAYRLGAVPNCVNLEDLPPRAATITIRHLDRVGVLASILQLLREANLNISNMQNRVFAGAIAAVATIDINQPVSPPTLDAIRQLDDVIQVSVIKA